MNDDFRKFLEEWQIDPLQAKPVFKQYYDYLAENPDIELDFKARPGISYSLRAKNRKQKKRNLFALVDVVDDEPKSRWLSVCFYADLVTDPEESGDLVPQGLFGEDAVCFNLDEDDQQARDYIFKRLKEAANNAADEG